MANTTNYAPTVNRLSGLMIFILIAMLALFSLVSVMMGIQIYNNVVATAESNSTVRTSLSYVATKIRAGDEAGMVELRSIGGLDVIVLGSYDEDELFYTYIYYADGALMEYYASAEIEFDPAYGANSVIAQVTDFEVSRDGNLFRFAITDEDGVMHEMHFYVYSKQPDTTGGAV